MSKMSCEIENCIVWDQDKRSSFAEHNLIMPDISIGNVGQLTVDLLLNNLEIEPIGRIVHACFYPFIGSDPFKLDSTRLASSCEIYECKEKKLIILQIRSRVFPSKFEEFKDLLIQFIKQFDFKQTILLASSSSEYFSAEQLYGVPVHYLKTSKFGNKEVFGHLRWKLFAFPDNIDTSIVSPVPGSFVSKDLLENCEKEDIALVVIICICSEGDNRPEALQMMNCLNAWLCLRQGKKSGESWTKPLSWKLPYGSSAPYTIY